MEELTISQQLKDQINLTDLRRHLVDSFKPFEYETEMEFIERTAHSKVNDALEHYVSELNIQHPERLLTFQQIYTSRHSDKWCQYVKFRYAGLPDTAMMIIELLGGRYPTKQVLYRGHGINLSWIYPEE